MYDPKNNFIYVSTKADKGAYLYAAVHEVGHMIKANNAEAWSRLESVMTDALRKNGVDIEERIAAAMEQYKRTMNRQKITNEQDRRDYAREEVMCNTLASILQDKQVVQEMVRQDRTLMERIVQAVKDVLDKMTKTIQSLGDDLGQLNGWKQMQVLKDDHASLQKMYDTMMGALEGAKEDSAAEGGVRFSLTEYSEKQIKDWENSKRIILYKNDAQMMDFIHKAMADKSFDAKMYFGAVGKDLANYIARKTNLNVEGYNCTLQAYEINKTLKTHGNEKKEALRGQRAITPEDFVRVKEVMESPQDVHLSDDTYDGKPAIIFEKTIDDSKMTVVAVVSDKHLDLRMQTMYAGAKKAGHSLGRAQTSGIQENLATPRPAKSQPQTPEAPRGTVSTDIVRPNTNNVNTKMSHHEDSDNNTSAIRYSLSGENAANTDTTSLNEAKAMLNEGTDAEAVRRKTGWFKGRDGKWRFELDDSKAVVKTPTSNLCTLGEILEHEQLYAAYPDLQDMQVSFQALGKDRYGQYHSKDDGIDIDSKLKSDPAELRKTLLHEVQHAIQSREGFAHGASPAYWEKQIDNGYDARTAKERQEAYEANEKMRRIWTEEPDFFREMSGLKKMEPTIPRAEVNWDTLERIGEDPVEWQQYDARREELEAKWGEEKVVDFLFLQYEQSRALTAPGRTPSELYYNTAGEVEARDVANRSDLTAEERKERAPYLGNEDTVFAEGYVPRMAAKKVSSKLKPSSGNLLSPSEYARFSSNMNDKNFRDYQYAKRPSGGVVVAMDNLLVYTDAKDAPVAVLEVFDDDIVTINDIQQDAINLEKEGFDIEVQRSILQSVYGERRADLRKSGELQKTGREDRGRTGSHEGRVREGDRTEVSFEERSDEEVENKRFSLRETDETVQEELATLKELHALTSAHRMTDKEAGWMARRVLKDAQSDYDAAQLAAELKHIFDYAERGNGISVEQMDSELNQLAEKVLAQSKTLDEEHEERMRPIRDFLRTNAISLTETQQKEAAHLFTAPSCLSPWERWLSAAKPERVCCGTDPLSQASPDSSPIGRAKVEASHPPPNRLKTDPAYYPDRSPPERSADIQALSYNRAKIPESRRCQGCGLLS